jgi:hypothetical protein
VELQAVAQREAPLPLVGAHRPFFDHLRLDAALLVGAEERVVDHVAVVPGHVLRGPDRVEDVEVRVRHDAQNLVLRKSGPEGSDEDNSDEKLAAHARIPRSEERGSG